MYAAKGMVQNDFPLFIHPSLLPLLSQSDKHNKEPICFNIYCTVYLFYITLFAYSARGIFWCKVFDYAQERI